MTHGTFTTPLPANEPVRAYAPGEATRASLKECLAAQASETVEVPLVIGGQRVTTGDLAPMVMPHNHGHVLGHYHRAGEGEVAAWL